MLLDPLFLRCFHFPPDLSFHVSVLNIGIKTCLFTFLYSSAALKPACFNFNSPDSAMSEDLEDEGMVEGVDTITRRTVPPKNNNNNNKQTHKTSCSVEIIVPSAYSTVPARVCSGLSTDSRPTPKNCGQKKKQVLDQAGAQVTSDAVPCHTHFPVCL